MQHDARTSSLKKQHRGMTLGTEGLQWAASDGQLTQKSCWIVSRRMSAWSPTEILAASIGIGTVSPELPFDPNLKAVDYEFGFYLSSCAKRHVCCPNGSATVCANFWTKDIQQQF